MTEDELRLLTLPEVAERLGCSRRAVELLIRAGELPAVRHLSRWRVRTDQLRDYLLDLETNQVAS